RGRAVIMLPAASRDGRISRNVPRLDGPVTTLRSEADFVVTEYGIAELRGRSLAERASALAAVAHPAHRDALLASADSEPSASIG
ncbi:MAG: acetyl-CoA hydrolase/transferase C-terminal domain-containing protein, partial [Alphaproteobacteria bacterium]